MKNKLLSGLLFLLLLTVQQADAQVFYGMTSSGGQINTGSIIKYNNFTSSTTVQKDLNGATGSAPYGSMTLLDGKFFGMTLGGGSGNGVLFEFDPVTSEYIPRMNFGTNIGGNPIGKLTVKDGKLYGMTRNGGAAGTGVIFEFDPLTNVYTKKKDLTSVTGNYPSGSLTLMNGKFYGMTAQGGNGYGVIFEWDPVTNIYTKKIDFNFTNGGFPEGSLTLKDGKFYGMTFAGGTTNVGVIFEWNPTTNVYTKKKDMSSGNGSKPIGNLTLKDAKFYGMTSEGGLANLGVIFEWDPVSNIYSKKIEFNFTNGRNPRGSLTLNDGQLYGMTSFGGTHDRGIVFEWNPVTNNFIKKVDFIGLNGATPQYSDLTFYQPCDLPAVANVIGGGSYCESDNGVPVGLNFSEIGVLYQLFLNGVAVGSSIMGTNTALSFGNKTEAGIYTVGANRIAENCIATMNGSATVSILPTTINTTAITVCESYTWANNNQTYTASGIYTGTTTNCVVEQLDLTITNSATNGSVTTTENGSYTWPLPYGTGFTYTTNQSGLTHTVGCNTATLNLTILVNTFNLGTSCGATVSSLAVTVVANAVPSATSYTFRITNLSTSASFIVTRPVNNFALSNYTGITLGTAYQVEVSVNGGANYGTPCIVNTPAPNSTIGAQCGTTLTSMGQFVYATYVSSVTGYRFRVTNLTTNTVQEYDALSGQNRFTFNQLSAAIRAFGTTYSVEVALRNTDGTYLSYNAACNITTPAFPTSEVILSQCDTVATSNTQTISAVVVSGATEYRFQLVNSGLSYSFSIDRPLNNFNLNMFPGLLSGTTYTVRVAVRIAGVWGPLTGKPCNITTPGIAVGGTRVVAANNTFAAVAYPNPFANNFMFDVTTTSESTIQISVYDMLGRQVENRNVEASAINNVQLGATYPSGVYNVIVSQGENTQTLRVIKR